MVGFALIWRSCACPLIEGVLSKVEQHSRIDEVKVID